MIRRLYLPFQSARAYKDRGMAKWMGFFISDHLSALQEDAMTVEFGDETSAEEILEWLSQIYIQQLTMTYYIKKKKSCSFMTGKILELTQEYMILHLTDTSYERVSLHSIIRLSKPASSSEDFDEP